MAKAPRLAAIQRDVAACERCKRLVQWRERVARDKRAAYAEQTYWGRAVPGFGDARARLVVVGLAPGAHGANRTGRIFTGDRSGDWLYRALHDAGFANQPTSVARDDGLRLHDAYVTCVVHCVPPQNKPTPAERDACLPYLVAELTALRRARVLVALGNFGWDGALRALRELGHTVRPKPKFAHGEQVDVGPYTLLGCFHPSQQNTFTGRLTRRMLDAVFARARTLTQST